MACRLLYTNRGEMLRGAGKSEAKWGAKMQAIKAINHVYDAELDMHRRNARMQGGAMRRLLCAILGFQSEAYLMGTPRRSIDREQQEYTPYYD